MSSVRWASVSLEIHDDPIVVNVPLAGVSQNGRLMRVGDCPIKRAERVISTFLRLIPASYLVVGDRFVERTRLVKEAVDFVVISFEGVAHDEEIAAVARDRVPVDDVGLAALLETGDGAGAAGGACVRGWRMHRVAAPDAVVPFADAFAGRYAEEEPARGIDVVIFKIDTLQPGIVPREVLGIDQQVEQPFFRDPIDAANERFGIFLERFENKAPALKKPIGLGARSAEMFLREIVELPWHVERADGSAVLKIDNPLARRVARDIGRASCR